MRMILGFLFLLGLVTAWCSQGGEGVIITSTAVIRQALEAAGEKPDIARVRQVVADLENNLWLWKVTLYAGIGVVACAAAGFSVHSKARSETSRSGS